MFKALSGYSDERGMFCTRIGTYWKCYSLRIVPLEGNIGMHVHVTPG